MLYFTVVMLICLVSGGLSYTFSTEEVPVISEPTISDRYFGYSVLLQKGESPLLTVGAPKGRLLNNKEDGGEVFQCKLNGTERCQSAFKNNDNLYNSPNGDFLGAAIDGAEDIHGLVMACSPRTPFQAAQSPNKTYLYGKCVFKKNSSNINDKYYEVTVQNIHGASTKKMDPKTRELYYDYGYALFGVDVSVFNKGYILCGVPGLQTTGATMLFPARSFEYPGVQKVSVLPKRSSPNFTEQDYYFGYAVNSAKNLHNNEFWLIAGAPRANNLTGRATLFTYVVNKRLTQMKPIETFVGDEFGSYFGASVLLANLSNGNILDVLVGAPLSAGNTFDEGCVYIYKSSKNRQPPKKIYGSGKEGSRFGTSITSLGDFDLDGFNDIAIAAPYEDDSEGAVYIYRGCADGIETQFSQRLSPSTFDPKVTAKGFGLGISKGVDIDQNGHNDIAIGAYKTDQVFIIKSKGIIDYQVQLKSDIDAIQENTTLFHLELCLNYSKRSLSLNVPSVEFEVLVDLDRRSKQNEIKDHVTVNSIETECRNYDVKLWPIGKTHEKDKAKPFFIAVELNTNTSRNIKAIGRQFLEKTIPYAIGCSNNTICITGLSIKATSKRSKIVLDKGHQIEIDITVINDGDPAYECELFIQTSSSVELRSIGNCNGKNGNYSCLFSDKVDKHGAKNGTYIFDLKKLDLNMKEVQINVTISSFGSNKKSYKNKDFVKIPVVVNSTSYIFGNSNPETIELSRTSEDNDTELILYYTIGKFGPSPLKINVTFLIPFVEYNGESIFKVLQVKGSIDNEPLTCIPPKTEVTIYQEEILDQINTNRIPLNRSVLIYCENIEDCVQYSCEGRLDNSNQKAVFEIRTLVTSKLIVKKFRYELRRKNLIAFLPVAVQQNSDDLENRVIAIAQFLIFVKDIIYVPLWIFIVGTVIGLLLLLLIIMSLYKCSFFRREYKDMIKEHLLEDAKVKEEDYCSPGEAKSSPIELRKTQAVENDYVEL